MGKTNKVAFCCMIFGSLLFFSLPVIIQSYRKLMGQSILSPYRTFNDVRFHNRSSVGPTENIKCDSHLSLVYAKTHKTGSTTVRWILMRHQEKRQWTSQVLRFPHPFLGGYPGPFRKNLTVIGGRDEKGRDWVAERITPDILMGHFRFQKEEVRALMNSKAKYITVLRDPMKVFESSFHFYYSRYLNRKKPGPDRVTCHEYPYLAVTKKRGVTFSDYITMADERLNETMPWFFRSRNYQAFDLGLDPMNFDDEYISREVRELDSTFDLVLILDHLLPSLVLLKDLLCIEWEDLIPPKIHKGSYERHHYTEKEKNIVRRLTYQDRVLYDYFNATLWRKVDEYGRANMERDIATLLAYINEDPGGERPVQIKKSKTQFRVDPADVLELDGARKPAKLIPQIWKTVKDNVVSMKTVKGIANHMVTNFGWCPYY